MKAPLDYLFEAKPLWLHTPGIEIDFVQVPSALRAVELAIADAVADGDRRVAEAQASAEKYKNMLVTAILRSGRR